MKQNTEYLRDIKQFLASIDITVQEGEILTNSFLRGIEIRDGTLVYQADKLHFPGDLLHEAGHIAIAPPDIRPKLQDDVAQYGQGPADEMAAIAWSWAALTAMNLPPEVVFHEKGYKGSSSNIIEAFASGFAFGHPMLSFWRMCDPFEDKVNGFPKMQCWLRVIA